MPVATQNQQNPSFFTFSWSHISTLIHSVSIASFPLWKSACHNWHRLVRSRECLPAKWGGKCIWKTCSLVHSPFGVPPGPPLACSSRKQYSLFYLQFPRVGQHFRKDDGNPTCCVCDTNTAYMCRSVATPVSYGDWTYCCKRHLPCFYTYSCNHPNTSFWIWPEHSRILSFFYFMTNRALYFFFPLWGYTWR